MGGWFGCLIRLPIGSSPPHGLFKTQIYKKADVVKRNKRMFGALMGHLGAAKKQLSKDEELLEKQKQRLTTLAEKVSDLLLPSCSLSCRSLTHNHNYNPTWSHTTPKEREESARIRHKLQEERDKERREELRKRAKLLLEQRTVEDQLAAARFAQYWRCVSPAGRACGLVARVGVFGQGKQVG